MRHASTLHIAWRNLWRNHRRTGLALLAIGVGQWAVLTTQGLMRGYGDNMQQAITGPLVGHVQIHHPDYRDEQALELVIQDTTGKLAAIAGLPHVENAVGRIQAGVLVAPRDDAFIATVIGIDVESESRPTGLISGNRTPLAPGHVMIGHRLAGKCGAGIGDEIALVGQAADGSLANDLFTVQQIIKGPSDIVNQTGVLMALADAQQFLQMPDQVHEILVRADRLEHVDALLPALQEMPALAGLEVAPWYEIVPELVMMIDMVDVSGWFVLILVMIAAVAGIMNTLVMSTYERMREFGMLLALGCSPRRIVRMIIIEALLLGSLGAALGTGAGGAFVAVFRRTGIDMASWGGEKLEDFAYAGMTIPLEIIPRIEWSDPLVGLAAVMIVSLLAAIWPAASAGRLDPTEAMRS